MLKSPELGSIFPQLFSLFKNGNRHPPPFFEKNKNKNKTVTLPQKSDFSESFPITI